MKSKFNETYEELMITESARPTKEMREWFEKRTNKHISAVQKNWRKLYDSKFNKYLEELPDKEKHIWTHDASKFLEPEYTPYIYITWNYRQKDIGNDWKMPDDMDFEVACFGEPVGCVVRGQRLAGMRPG